MRRDNASNHLTRLIAAARRLKGRWKPGAWVPLGLIFDPDVRLLRPNTNPKRNVALRDAFAAFDLDPNKPENWRLLLTLFAEAYFVSHRPRGGKKYWNGEELCQLLADFAAVKKKKGNQGLTEAEICEKVKAAFPKRYSDVPKAATIRRRLPDARNPDKNDILGRILGKRSLLDPRTDKERRAHVIELISKQWKLR
jgi:hypothetical protein